MHKKSTVCVFVSLLDFWKDISEIGEKQEMLPTWMSEEVSKWIVAYI